MPIGANLSESEQKGVFHGLDCSVRRHGRGGKSIRTLMPVVDSMEALERSTMTAKTMVDGNRRLSRTSAAGWSVSHVETILIEKVQQRTRCDSDRMKKIYGIFNDGFQDADDPGHAGIDREEFAKGLHTLGIKIPISTCNALFRKIDNVMGAGRLVWESSMNTYL
jgi:hypothetical protein